MSDVVKACCDYITARTAQLAYRAEHGGDSMRLVNATRKAYDALVQATPISREAGAEAQGLVISDSDWDAFCADLTEAEWREVFALRAVLMAKETPYAFYTAVERIKARRNK